MIRPIEIYPSPVLTEVCVEVPEELFQSIGEDLVDTLLDSGGIGLAAPQIGLPYRAFAIIKLFGDRSIQVYINPVLTKSRGGSKSAPEGCLSIPGLVIPVTRAKKIRISSTDSEGGRSDKAVINYEARVIQHEYDHLDGVLTWDYLKAKERTDTIQSFLAGLS